MYIQEHFAPLSLLPSQPDPHSNFSITIGSVHFNLDIKTMQKYQKVNYKHVREIIEVVEEECSVFG